MKKILLFLISLFIILNAYSQYSEFILNKKETFEDELKFVAKHEKDLILRKIAEKKRIYLCYFNAETLVKNSEKEIKFPNVNDQLTEFEDIFYFNNRICLFTSDYNKKLKHYTLYVSEYNDNGEIISAAKEVDNIKWTNKNFRKRYEVSLSNDSSKILIYHKLDEYDDKNTLGKISFKILDEKLNLVLNKEIELEKSFSKYELSNFLVNKSSNIYFIEKEVVESSKNEDLYKVNVVVYNPNTDKVAKTEVNIDEKRILSHDLQLTKQGNILITGAYAIDRDFSGSWKGVSSLKGLFCSLIDTKTNNVLSKYKKDIDIILAGDRKEDFFKNSSSILFMVEDGKHLYRYRLKNTFQLDDDQVVLLVQFEHSINGSYLKGPIIAVNFNLKDEQKSWINAYPFKETKSNETNNKETFSYVAFISKNKINVIYNFNRQLKIRSNGDFTDNELFLETKENKKMFLSKYFYSAIYNELYILGTEGNLGPTLFNYSVCKINFKD